MGRMIEHPRYNIVSTRLADVTYFDLVGTLNGRTVADFLASAVEEKLIRERQTELDESLRAAGVR